MPPAGSATFSRSFCVPGATGAAAITVITSRKAGPASVSAPHPVTVPTATPGAAMRLPGNAELNASCAGPVSVSAAGAVSQGASHRSVYVAGGGAGRSEPARSSAPCRAAPPRPRSTAPVASPGPTARTPISATVGAAESQR